VLIAIGHGKTKLAPDAAKVGISLGMGHIGLQGSF
jgi:hypothetical protein